MKTKSSKIQLTYNLKHFLKSSKHAHNVRLKIYDFKLAIQNMRNQNLIILIFNVTKYFLNYLIIIFNNS